MSQFNSYLNNTQANNQTQQEVLRSKSNKQENPFSHVPVYASSLKHKFLTKNVWQDFSPSNHDSKQGYEKVSLHLSNEVKSQRVQSRILQRQQQFQSMQRSNVAAFQFQIPLNGLALVQGYRFSLNNFQQKQSRKITACLKLKHWINQYLQSKVTNQDLLNSSKNKEDLSERLNNRKLKPLTREDLLLIYAFDRIQQFTMKSPLSNNQSPQESNMNQYAYFRRQQILQDYMQSSSNIIQQEMTKSQGLHQGIHKLKGQLQFLLRMNKRQSFINIKIYAQQRYQKIKHIIQRIERVHKNILIRSVFNLFKFQTLSQSNVHFYDDTNQRLQHSAIDSSILSSPLFQLSLGVKQYSNVIYFGHNFNQEYEKLAENQSLFGCQQQQKAINLMNKKQYGQKNFADRKSMKTDIKIQQESQELKHGNSGQSRQKNKQRNNDEFNLHNRDCNQKKLQFASIKPHKKKSPHHFSKQSSPKQMNRQTDSVAMRALPQKFEQRHRTVLKQRPKKAFQNQITVNFQHTTPPIQQRRHLIVRTNLYEFPLNDNQFDTTDRQCILPDFNKSLSINSRSVNVQKGYQIYHLIPDLPKFQQPDTDSCYPGTFFKNSFINLDESQRVFTRNITPKKSVYDLQSQKTIIQRPVTTNQRELNGKSSFSMNNYRQQYYTKENSNNASIQTLKGRQAIQKMYHSPYYTPRSQSPIIIPVRNNFSPINLPINCNRKNIHEKNSVLPQQYRNQYITGQKTRTRINAETINLKNDISNSPSFTKMEGIKKNTAINFILNDNQSSQTVGYQRKIKTQQEISYPRQNNFHSEYQIGLRTKIGSQITNVTRNQYKNAQTNKISSMECIPNYQRYLYQGNQRKDRNQIQQSNFNHQQERIVRKGIRSAKKIIQNLQKSQNTSNLKQSHSGKLLLTLKPSQKQSLGINRVGKKN